MRNNEFRQTLQFTVGGTPNEMWAPPTKALVAKMKSIFLKGGYSTEDVTQTLSQIDMMLQGRSPERNLLETLRRDLSSHLEFMKEVESILSTITLLDD